MKKFLSLSLVLLVIVPCARAEQCKSCNFTTGDLMTFLVFAVLICLALVFIAAAVIFFALNRIQTVQRKYVGITYSGSIIGGVLGFIANARHGLHGFFIVPLIMCTFIGAVIAYFLSPKKEPANNEQAKNDDAGIS